MADDDKKNPGFICASATTGCSIIVVLILSLLIVIGGIVGICILIGVNSVYYTKFGIKFDTFTKTIEKNTLYQPGVYLAGWGKSFIEFPRIFAEIDMAGGDADTSTGSVNARTYDGLSVIIDVSFQYSLPYGDASKFFSMFDQFSDKYEEIVTAVTRDNIRDSASNFTAINFFENRTSIGIAMEKSLKHELSNININVEFFQLRSVRLPAKYETILREKEISRQKITTANIAQLKETVVADTGVLVAKTLAAKTIAEMDGTAYARNATNAAAGRNIVTRGDATQAALQDLKTKTGFDNSFALKSYYIHTIQDTKQHAQAMIQMDKPAIVKIN